VSGGCGEGCGFCGRCDAGQPFDAHCEDCGDGFYLGRWDIGITHCESCTAKREAWAEAFEVSTARRAQLRERRMLKVPSAAPPSKKDVA